MNWSDFETYLKPVHLQGKPHQVKIERIEIERVFLPRAKRLEPVPVLYLVGGQRGLILNATRRKTLAAMFGDDSSAAVGKAIVLEPGKNEHGETILIKPASS